MPGKFVTNAAEKAGVSLETAEEKWAAAKKAVKKGKRRGSWYWGKVMNTFKRMMGLMESTSFKEYIEMIQEAEEFEWHEAKMKPINKWPENSEDIWNVLNDAIGAKNWMPSSMEWIGQWANRSADGSNLPPVPFIYRADANIDYAEMRRQGFELVFLED